MEIDQMNSLFWKKKKIFITGHSGFKGKWLTHWLLKKNSIICGFSNTPLDEDEFVNEVSSIEGDVRDFDLLNEAISSFKPDIIFHLAAQPLVRDSYLNPRETFDVNIMGTVNILEISRSLKYHHATIIITSDKCYQNDELGIPFSEMDPLMGKDPYSSSKSSAELVTYSYFNSFFKDSKLPLASARAGNVIGGGDFSDDRIIPDFFKSLTSNIPLLLRYPKAIRPWQFVLEPLNGYLILAEKIYNDMNFCGAWNFGTFSENEITVENLVLSLNKKFNNSVEIIMDPMQAKGMSESSYLKLDCKKSLDLLNWKPYLKIDETLDLISQWHIQNINKAKKLKETHRQIEYFERFIGS